jgi:hypothetical protein
MAKPMTIQRATKTFHDAFNEMYARTIHTIIKRKKGYALTEHTLGMADDVIIADNLTKDEAYALYNITTGESIK